MMGHQEGRGLDGIRNIFKSDFDFINSRLSIGAYADQLNRAKKEKELSKTQKESEELSNKSFIDQVLPRNSKKRIIFS